MSSGISATMGTLSGEEKMFQSCRQSIARVLGRRSLVVGPWPATLRLLSLCYARCCSQTTASSRLNLRFQHDRGRAGDAAVFPHAPEMHDHEYRRDDGN